ncbi:uncharacterized protein LOC134070335 [Sardina pilchardus]|uniref:uncharacterized protein LOC134070335 n=1 Tax=Sardina pilchardus TaxID=27697 RepID=UPI002E12D7F9
MEHVQIMLAAGAPISIVAVGLTVLTWRIVISDIVTAIAGANVRLAEGILQTMVRTVVTRCVNLAGGLDPVKEKGLASLVVSEYGAVGAALGGAVGGAVGGTVNTLLGDVLPVFGQATGVALGVVLGRIFGQAFTSEILRRNAITDKGIAGPLGGALAGGFGALFGLMAGGVIGGFMGALLGAVGGKYLGNWLKKTFLGGQQCFISVLSAIAVGLITSLGHITTIFGVIGLLGSLVAILVVLTVSNRRHTSKATHTSTNVQEAKGEEHSNQAENEKGINIIDQKLVWQYFALMLSALGLITILFTGVTAALTLVSLAVIAAVLELFSGAHESKGSSEVVTAAKSIVEPAVTSCGKLDELLKQVVRQKVTPIVLSKRDGDACTTGGAIGGAVGGTIGGAAVSLLKVIHPVFGQAVGGALGVTVGWKIGKAFTTDILNRNGQMDKHAAGALGGAIGGNIGAFFGFMTGGVVGGLIGGVIGMMGDRYLGIRS